MDNNLLRSLVNLTLATVFATQLCDLCIADESLKKIELQSKIENVQPMTGIVLWSTNEAIETAPIRLKYSYLTYRDVVVAPAQYDWSKVETLLNQAAARKHQLALRWHDGPIRC